MMQICATNLLRHELVTLTNLMRTFAFMRLGEGKTR
jgi:hypothetical protein